MADGSRLTAKLTMLEEVTSKFSSIVSAGASVTSTFEDIHEASNDAFDVAVADQYSDALESASASADALSGAARDAADATDYWTSAVGNYDKSALEAVYSTEELVDMGFKTQEALDAERAAAEQATASLEDLAESSEEVSALQEDMGGSGVDAIGSISGALTAAGITAILKDVAEAVYDMADAFSEAESVIVKATGATGEQLESLNASMLKVYATVDDADMTSTAGAIGEINTRLGLQGEELENVTSLFMQYADNTNSEVVSAVQSVTKVMKNWNVEVEDTELLLDKFTYAAQASGASVDSLSNMVYQNKAYLDQLGYSLDESIALFSMLEYEGIEASSVMMGFRTAITNFSNDGLDASAAMQAVIEQIGSMADASEATSLAIDTFGSRVGAQLTDKIRSGKFEIEEWTAAIADAGGTLAETDEAADTLADKWTMASNSMKTAFTSVLEPAVGAASSALAGIVQGAGDFLNAHPNVTKALTAVGVGVGVVAVGIAGVAAVTLVAIPAITAMGTALSAAIWPITLIAAGIAAVTAAALFLVDAFGSVDEETAGMTATTREQYYELQVLNAEYEETVSVVGETDDAALRLRYQIEDLTAEFEASRMTVEEFTAQCDSLVSSHDKLVASYKENTASINQEEVGTLSLIQKLGDLASSTEQTASTQAQMQTIVDSLNKTYPDLALTVDDVTASTEAMVAALKAVATEQAEQARYEETQRAYIELYQEQAGLLDQIAAAEENIRLEQERMDSMSGWAHFWTKGEWDDLEAYEEALASLQGAYGENQATLSEYEDIFDEVARAAEESANAMVDSETAVGDAISSVQEEMNELAAAYDAAYESALTSVQGQYSLWDEAAEVVATSASSIISNLEGQAAYWQDYNTSLEGLTERSGDIEGLAELISTFADGSADSVNAVAGMASATDEELATMVASWQTLQEEQASVSGSLAELETNFSATLESIQGDMEAAIVDMTMEAEAQEAAKATITAYINQIKSMTSEASSAAAAVASAATSALSGSGTGAVGVRGYASGTVSADDVYIAGEDGPELIVGAGGSTVFPTSETSQILNAIEFGRQRELDTGVLAASRALTETRSELTTTDTKTISLQINGTGAMTIDGSLTENEVLEILYYNLKPILLNIVKSEIMEEGEGSYDF